MLTPASEVIRLVQERQDECLAAVGVTFPSLPGRVLQLIDVQNLFCEVDKYGRVAYPQFTSLDGRHRIKQRFQPTATMPPLRYPPKWGSNDRLVTGSKMPPTPATPARVEAPTRRHTF